MLSDFGKLKLSERRASANIHFEFLKCPSKNAA